MADNYIPRLFRFLREVEANNNRPWFTAHKSEYDELRALWLADLDRLICLMTEWEPGMATQTARTTAYRFYRDTRFSHDKTPYKTFFSALLSPFGRKTLYASYYIETGLRPDDSGLYGGLWMPPPPMLRKVRQAIVDNIDEFNDIITDPDFLRLYPAWYPHQMLKTVPKGWDRHHPLAPLLRMRMYGRFCPCSEDFFADPAWPEKASERLRVLKPFIDFLNYSIDEPDPFTL